MLYVCALIRQQELQYICRVPCFFCTDLQMVVMFLQACFGATRRHFKQCTCLCQTIYEHILNETAKILGSDQLECRSVGTCPEAKLTGREVTTDLLVACMSVTDFGTCCFCWAMTDLSTPSFADGFLRSVRACFNWLKPVVQANASCQSSNRRSTCCNTGVVPDWDKEDVVQSEKGSWQDQSS